MSLVKYKWEQLADQLIEKIEKGHFAMGTLIDSERKLSRDYKVSRDCVRMVLDKLEADKKIVKVAGKGAFAGGLLDVPYKDRPRSGLIGLTILGTRDQTNVAVVLHSLANVIKKAGFNVVVEPITDDPAEELKGLESLLRRQVDGIIILPTSKVDADGNIRTNCDFYKKLSDSKMPFVILDRYLPGSAEFNCVTYEIEKPFYDIMKLLAATGNSRIAYVGHDFNLTGRLRFYAYQAAIEALNLEIDNRRVIMCSPQKEHWESPFLFGYYAGGELTRMGKNFDSIMCYSDQMAYGVFSALKDSGFNGKGKWMGSFETDNIPDDEYQKVLVTTMVRPLGRMAHRAGEVLLSEIIGNTSEPALEKMQVKVLTENSTSRISIKEMFMRSNANLVELGV